MKICNKCNVEQPIENFYAQTGARTKPGYRRPTCKSCVNKESIAWSKANKDKVKEHRRKGKLKQKYGISLEQFEEMKNKQNNKCAICNEKHIRRPLNVDHCHATGKVRGLLCDKCNMALGLLKDSKQLIESLKRYLDAHTSA